MGTWTMSSELRIQDSGHWARGDEHMGLGLVGTVFERPNNDNSVKFRVSKRPKRNTQTPETRNQPSRNTLVPVARGQRLEATIKTQKEYPIVHIIYKQGGVYKWQLI